MQAVRIAAARQHAAGEFIHDQDLIVLDHVVLVAEHEVVGPQGKDDIVLDLLVFDIRQVVDLEELFDLVHALCGQMDLLFLLVDDKVAGLLLLFLHDDVHLGEFFGLTAL